MFGLFCDDGIFRSTECGLLLAKESGRPPGSHTWYRCWHRGNEGHRCPRRRGRSGFLSRNHGVDQHLQMTPGPVEQHNRMCERAPEGVLFQRCWLVKSCGGTENGSSERYGCSDTREAYCRDDCPAITSAPGTSIH